MQREEARENKAAEPQWLSKSDSQLIWRAVLDAARSVSTMPPEALARSLLAARKLIGGAVKPEADDAS